MLVRSPHISVGFSNHSDMAIVETKGRKMKKLAFLGLVAIFSLLNAVPGHAEDAEPMFSLKTPIAKIIASPAGRAVIDAEMPGFFAHPMFEQFKLKSIDELTVMLGGAEPERLAAIDKALRAIPVDAVKSTEVATGQSSAAVEANPAPGK